MLEFGWFTTGRDEAARQLLDTVLTNIRQGEINGRIQFVFISREPGESRESDNLIATETRSGLPVSALSYEKYKASNKGATTGQTRGWPEWRTRYDQEVVRLLKPFSPSICVMAGYMLILSPDMCRAFCFLNLHPAVPGGFTGTWQEVMWKLIQSRSSHAGAMMHLVTPELDRGPAATYFRCPIQGAEFAPLWKEIEGKHLHEIQRIEGENNRLFKLIRHHELTRELPLIVKTLKAFGDGRIAIKDNRLTDRQGRTIQPYDLTLEIEESLKH